jgi:hypothetical protein
VGGRVAIAVQRFCPPRLAVSRSTRLLLALGVALGGAQAMAQTPLYPDPLAPKLQSDPRNPPRFQKPARVQSNTPARFTAPASGAGSTGYDASNNPARKAATAAGTNAGSTSPSDAPAEPLSPYQEPPPSADNANSALAQAPGTPPVELGPIRRAPKKRKAHTEPDDPYAALGMRAGSFTLYPAIELIGGYDTNPGHAAGGKGAALYTAEPELRVQSNWSRHELKADLRGSYTGYSPDQTPTLSRPFFDGKVGGRIDVTSATRIDLNSHALVSTDNPGSPNLQADIAKLPVFTTVGGDAGIAHRFNRFEIGIKGAAERTEYQDSALTDGTTASNQDRNYNQYGGTLRGSYELTPGVKPFVELETDTRRHDLETDFSGYQRNSKGVTGTVGSTFELTRQLTGEIGIGYTQRNYEDPRLEKLAGLIGDASLIWTASALTAVKFTGKSAVGETVIPGVSGELSRDVGVQVDHSFRRWLIGSVKLGFGIDDYVGLDREDRRYSAGIGLTYKFNRNVQLKGEIRQDWLHSNVLGNDYSASVFLLGVRVQQ